MNRNAMLIYSIFSCLSLNSCHHKDTTSPNPLQDGNWVNLIPFGGVPRTEAVTFVTGNYAYIGTGLDQQQNRYNDLWQFDPVKTTWYQVAENANMSPRNSAVAFAINGKGYVGSGFDGTNALSDFRQYDPSQTSWLRITDFPDSARYEAVAFGIAGYGYFTTGTDGKNYFDDCWKYDPTANTWTKQEDLPGFKRSGAVSFVYNNKGYIVTGIGSGGSTVNDFFSFDPTR